MDIRAEICAESLFCRLLAAAGHANFTPASYGLELNFPSQLSEARQAMKKMAASPTMAITSFAITIK